MWRNSSAGYGVVAIALHWIMALAVFALFGLGLWMVELTYYSSWYQTAPAIHKGSGVLLLALLLLRLVWRAINPKPAPHTHHPKWQQLGAKVGHGLLYFGLMLVLISGYLISTADGRAIEVFGLFAVPSLMAGGEAQAELAGQLHFYGAWALVLAAVGHGLAAIGHQIFHKDGTLTRILKPVTHRS